MICFNKLLAEWIAGETEAYHLTRVGTFHSVAQSIIRNSEYDADYQQACEDADESERFREILPFYAELALIESDPICDTLVIDEAQDLIAGNVLAVLNGLLLGGLDGGRLAVFGDFHRQAIYSSEKQEYFEDSKDSDNASTSVDLLRSVSPSITLVPLSVN